MINSYGIHIKLLLLYELTYNQAWKVKKKLLKEGKSNWPPLTKLQNSAIQWLHEQN